jgi:hypothetical protein
MEMEESYRAFAENVSFSDYYRVTEEEAAETEDAEHHSRVDAKAVLDRVSVRFNMVAMATAAAYAVFFFASLVLDYLAWEPDVLDVSWNLQDSPRTLIAFSLMFAAAFLWLLRGPVTRLAGSLLGLAFLGHALLQFYWWYDATSRFKANLGGAVPDAGVIGNVWLGASWIEPLVFAAALALFLFNACYLGQGLISRYAKGAEDANESGRLYPRPH